VKIAIITGGSRGLGKAAALNLADKGVDSIITYNAQADAANAVVAEIQKKGRKAVALKLDIVASASFVDFAAKVKEALKATWNRDSFDFLVNNAGFGLHKSIAETTEAELDSMYAAHFKGPFLLTQKLFPLIAQGGRVINISSGLARFSFPGYAAYGSMKAGLEGLTRYMAKEFGEKGIAVNSVAPGAIETDFGGGAVRDNPELKAMLSAQTALGRVGLPDDIGGVIAALLSEDSKWINAQRIEVSGGIFV
jgi:NAD(P)-dependent dehydrogenase (short-subunit alcohol dehydrogenase family)